MRKQTENKQKTKRRRMMRPKQTLGWGEKIPSEKAKAENNATKNIE